MAGNEATISGSLTIRKISGSIVTLDYQRAVSFTAAVAGTKGPMVGAFDVNTNFQLISLAEVGTPGLAWFKNQDPTNFVTYGMWDPDTSKFYPLGELLPGESFPLRLSRSLGQESGSGPGTSGATNNSLMFRADTATCNVLVEIFDA